MQNLFMLLLGASICCFVVGMIKPSLVLVAAKGATKEKTRLDVALKYIALAIFSWFASGQSSALLSKFPVVYFLNLLYYTSAILFVVGMINPSAAIWWGAAEKQTRKAVAITYIALFIFSLLAMAGTLYYIGSTANG